MQEFQNAAYGTGGQLAPQGIFGGMFGAPLGGAIGRGIGGLLGNAGLGGQIGQFAGGIGGSLLPFGADPVSQAYAQQAQQQQAMQQLQQLQQQQGQMGQLAPQGWIGDLISRAAGPAGGIVDSVFGTNLGSTFAGPVGQLSRLLPFGADPVSQAYAQQAQQQQALQQLQQLQQQQGQAGQLAPQGWIGDLISRAAGPAGGIVDSVFGTNLGSTFAGPVGQLSRLLPFGADPVSQAYAQQAQQQQAMQQLQQQQGQLAPQGWIGDLISRAARPAGGIVDSVFGTNLGSTFAGPVSQVAKLLPFGAQAQGGFVPPHLQQLQQQIQQLQQQYQQQVAQLIAQQQQQQQPQQVQAQQGQLGPQGWFGNIIGQVGRPLGGAIGTVFGNAGLGSTIGGVAGQIGQMLPFGTDPITAAYAQQAQLAQQQGLPQYSSQQTLH